MNFDNLLNRLALAEVLAAGAVPEMADAAAAVVASRLKIAEREGQAIVQVVDDKGTVRIGNVRGDDLDVTAYVREVAKARPVLFRPAPEAEATSSSAVGASPSPGETITDQMARLNREREARSARASELGAKSWPNPWSKGAENITRQMVLLNIDPARASRFQAEAGAR